MISKLDLEPKSQGHSKKEKIITQETKNATSKKLSRVPLVTDVQLVCQIGFE